MLFFNTGYRHQVPQVEALETFLVKLEVMFGRNGKITCLDGGKVSLEFQIDQKIYPLKKVMLSETATPMPAALGFHQKETVLTRAFHGT